MANGHVRPGQSVTWRNETGAPVRSGALVSFGGGIAAKALQDIPAGQEGVVTLFQVHRFPLPDGLSFSPGDMVYVDGGEIAASGDVLGRFLRLDEGGWAEVLIMPLNEGGGGGGTSDIAWKPAVSAEGVITWARSSSATAPPAQNIKGPQGDKGEKGDPGPEGPQGPKGEKGDPGTGGDAKAFVATYNVTSAQEIRNYLDAANEPFAPVVVKRGNDYYTAALATKSGDDAAILRVMGSGGGNYILFNYTVRGTAWSSNSYIFQKQLVSGTDIRTVDGQSILGAGDLATAPDWANVANKPAGLVIDANYTHTDENYSATDKTKLDDLEPIYSLDPDAFTLAADGTLSLKGSGAPVDWANVQNKPADLVRDAAYVHTDSNYTAAEKTKLAGLANYDDAPLAARVSTLENAGYQTAQDVDDKIGEALETFDKLDYKVADSPPTPTTVVIKGQTETTRPGVRYMVKHATDDRYEEYILIDGVIYDIGDTGDLDLSGYATTAAMETALAGKQATLVSGTNIKTVNNQSLLGSGNIDIGGGSGNSFLITKGTTTYAQLVANKSKEMWFVDPAETTFAPRPVIACVVRETSQQVLITVQKTTSSNEVWQVGSNNAWSVVQTNQFLKLPQYQLSNNDSGGNVIQRGEIVISGATYGLFEFYFQTGLLPAANATEVYNFANLLASYTIHSFVDATGMTDDGIFIGNGRTDNENRLIVQQFSKNSKNVTIRAYKDFSSKTALLKVQFIGTKN